MSPNGGMLFVVEGSTGDHRLRRIPLTVRGEARGPGAASPMVAAARLFAARLVGDVHLSLLLETCEGRLCLSGDLWDASGAPLGHTLGGPLVEFSTVKNASTARELIFGLGREEAPAELVLFTHTGTGLTVRQVPLPAAEGKRTEMLGMTGEGERWAAIYRVGAAEGHGSEVLLTSSASSSGAPRSIEALHDALAIESMKMTAEGVAVIAAFEFSRPRFMVLSLDGESRANDSEPLLVPPGTLPPLFEGTRRAFVRDDGEQLSLDIETGAGDPIAREVVVLSHVGSPRPPADVARSGGGFVVATRSEGGIVTVVVTCSGNGNGNGNGDVERER